MKPTPQAELEPHSRDDTEQEETPSQSTTHSQDMVSKDPYLDSPKEPKQSSIHQSSDVFQIEIIKAQIAKSQYLQLNSGKEVTIHAL
jgi:anti-sigma28 factor (negative regulator of flagellin synthesis)